jgi:dihydroneopterin aldolase
MHSIRIDTCAFLSRHGVLATETTRGRRFHVEVTLARPR